jgi:TRAP-type C4-dicarboxylate transport system permease small subunit
MHAFEQIVDRLSAVLKWIGGLSLAGMMLITCLDVVLRAAGQPQYGMVEGVSLLAVLVLASALPITQRDRGHVALDMLVRRFSDRTSAVVDAAGQAVACGLFAVVSWQCWLYAASMAATGQVSQSLELPLHWLVRAVSLAFAILCLALLADIAASIRRAMRNA